MLSMASGVKMLSGSFVPTETDAAYTLDTGSTNWTHLLITPRVFPYDQGMARCIGVKYINLDTMRLISAFGSSNTASTVASSASTYVVNVDAGKITVNNGVVTFGGAPSQVGVFVEGCTYDWYAW